MRATRSALSGPPLNTIFQGDASLIRFVQMATGYSLTAATEEQALFFLYGTGRNGKSTFTETLQTLLGSYAQHAPAALFVADRHGHEPEKEVARLVGSRLVIGSEIEEGAKFAESRVKDLTGQDTLTGRFLYSSPFDFKPTHKLWIFGNHKPDIRGNDLGIWRRMRLIPFTVQIEESKIDKRLPSKLVAELPGILNWAIEGCLAWQKRGFHTPNAVKAATDECRDEEDELGEFIEDRCFVSTMAEIPRWELHSTYLEWAQARGTKVPMKPKAFAKRLRSRVGISERKSGNEFLFDTNRVHTIGTNGPRRHISFARLLQRLRLPGWQGHIGQENRGFHQSLHTRKAIESLRTKRALMPEVPRGGGRSWRCQTLSQRPNLEK